MKLEYTIQPTDQYQTVKQILKENFLMSDRLILKLKHDKKIYLNLESVYIDHKVFPYDIITILLDFEEDNSNVAATKMNLSILYEDEYYLVIDKPFGMPIHPSILHYEDSVSNGVKYYFDIIGLHKKIRPVNRLDKDTSGVVIFAKNEYIQECLVKQMHMGNFEKIYIAICEGRFLLSSGTISAPIARKEGSIIERCVNESGDPSITHYEVLKQGIEYAVLRLTLETGRTHQIRVHTAYLGHPIIGDTLYGTSSDIISRQALHCYKQSFIHPITKQKVTYLASVPKDMKKIIDSL